MGVPVSGNVSENAPLGTYSVTRLTNPTNGRFDLFSSGAFTYIPEPKFDGIVKFRYIICSDLCTQLCDTGEVRILIQPVKDTVKVIEVAVPNAITPNGDGKNDALVIDGIDQFAGNELVIFNRWGDVLYTSKPYKNDWRGTNQNGQDLPEGTYYYVLRLNTADGKILRGDMTVLR
jgi:large repetitive protein